MPGASIVMAARTYPVGVMGGGNPLSVMQSALNLRDTQMEFNARLDASQRINSSPDMPSAIESMKTSPYAAWELNMMQNLQNQMQTEAQTGRIGAETYRTNFETSMEAYNYATARSFTPGDLVRNMNDAWQGLPPAVQQETEATKNDIVHVLTDGLNRLPPGDQPGQREYVYLQRLAALRMQTGTPPAAAAALGGWVPPQIRPDIPSRTGLTGPGLGIPPGSYPGVGGSMALPAAPIPYIPLDRPSAAPAPAAAPPPATAPPSTVAAPTPAEAPPPPPAPVAPAVSPGVIYPAPEGERESAKEIAIENRNVTERAPAEMQRLNLMDGALHEIQAGGWARNRMYAAQDVQGIINVLRDAGIPISDAAINKVAGKTLSGAELLNALITPFVTQAMREAVAGTMAGRVRDEVTAWLNSASLATDPNTLLKLLNQVKFGMAVGLDRAKEWQVYRNLLQSGRLPGYYPSDFYRWYNHQPNLERLNKEYGGNMNLSPYTGVGVPGAREEPETSQQRLKDWPEGVPIYQRKGGKTYKFIKRGGKWEYDRSPP